MSKSKKKNGKKGASASKVTVVNRKFMMDLANRIYDPKTKKFLHLCDGKLQNGPDPTDEERPMHCGLGELYYAMTGAQPLDDGVSEDDVVDLAVSLSSFPKKHELEKEAVDAIRSLKLLPEMTEQLLSAIDNMDEEDFISNEREDFSNILTNIPSENDDSSGNSCNLTTFRSRSQRVAASLRKAAKLLPT